jgi:serine/threonine-protein kinase
VVRRAIPPRIGTEFAGYRIEALLGRGGSSTVYRAESPRLGIQVALKILNADVSGDESFRERFVRESKLAAAINHPNVITIYDAGAEGDELYIALRYVAGGDLRDALRDGALEPERALSILAQVAGGLDAAHARGLVHRDVKPANIMLDSGLGADAPEIAYVTDFGLIKELHSPGRATATGDLLGTIDYVAPEQIEGRAADARADLYALGCVAFECLTGRTPFERDNEAAVLWAHMKEPPPAASGARPDLPPGVDEAIARALAKEPADRYDTCLELVGALRAELALPASPGGRATLPLPRPVRRRGGAARLLAAGAACLLLGAAGASAAFLLAGGDGGDGREAAPAAETRTVITTVEADGPAELPAYIPETFRDRCKAARAPTPDFDASFVCRLDGPARIVRYSHAIAGPAMAAYLRGRLRALGLPAPPPPERIRAAGSCIDHDLPAVAEWNLVGRAGHEAIDETFENASDGRVICHTSDGTAHLEWNTADIGIYAHAYGPDLDALRRWWETAAGPVF